MEAREQGSGSGIHNLQTRKREITPEAVPADSTNQPVASRVQPERIVVYMKMESLVQKQRQLSIVNEAMALSRCRLLLNTTRQSHKLSLIIMSAITHIGEHYIHFCQTNDNATMRCFLKPLRMIIRNAQCYIPYDILADRRLMRHLAKLMPMKLYRQWYSSNSVSSSRNLLDLEQFAVQFAE